MPTPLLTKLFRPPRHAACPGAYSECMPRHSRWAPQDRTGIERLDAAGFGSAQVVAWAQARNADQTGIHWQFRTADARVRLKQRIFPCPCNKYCTRLLPVPSGVENGSNPCHVEVQCETWRTKAGRTRRSRSHWVAARSVGR